MSSILKVDSIEERVAGSGIAVNHQIKIASMTESERDSIASPQAGDLIYNSETKVFNYHNGTSWGAVGGGTSLGMVIALGE